MQLDPIYPWQEEALAVWKEHNYRGVIQAVTGAGKTRIAHEAIVQHLDATKGNGHILIIVPNKSLLDKWYTELDSLNIINESFIGRLGDGHQDQFDKPWKILIAIDKSLARQEYFISDYINENGLLIADECHHYGAEKVSRALAECYTKRLGLTATYDRDDNGVEKYLDPYFNFNNDFKGPCYTLNYEKALAAEVISHFNIGFIGVELSGKERMDYDQYDSQCHRYSAKLINQYQITSQPFGEFMKEVVHLSTSNKEGAKLAGYYLNAFGKRRQVLANACSKMDSLKELEPVILAAERTIIFSQTKESAEEASKTIKPFAKVAPLHSGMKAWERKQIFTDFEEGDTDVIAAPLLLDEGVNVPSADLAIILACSRSKRQMIQRMGRVIRTKRDGRVAKIVIIYAKNTSEDPESGAHQDFIEEIKKVADNYGKMYKKGGRYFIKPLER
ncbi:DNA repair helicase [Spirochaetia bacterium]|nr:DNA repair helicase [Spirochaetia bacterium]